jgi:putative oxidoreductase
VGYQTRVVAAALTVYCLLTAAIFHTSLSDPVQNLMLLKNIAMAGGFMLLSYVGAGRISIDGRNANPSLRVISRGMFHS